VPTITPPTVSGSSSGTGSVAASASVTEQFFAGAINTGQGNYGGMGSASSINTGSSNYGGLAGGVTVNIGVVGDPEAAARTITDVMNNSYYRGTGGATAFQGAT
jgi:hypothetical protein